MRGLTKKSRATKRIAENERRDGGKPFGFAASDGVCFSLSDFARCSFFLSPLAARRRDHSFARVSVFSNFIGLMFKTHGTDAAGSTYKILAACVFMPLTWLITAESFFIFSAWQIALASIPLTILCGYVALRSSETLIDMRVWLKSAWLLFRQRALFLRLMVQRQTLQKEIGELIEK
jgi:hypothetical protein